MKKFGFKNELSSPRFEKVVINVGLGRMSQQPNFEDKILPEIMKDLGMITGQHPKTAPAKKSIAGFKSREGQIVGMISTLRGKMMYDFIERLIKVAFPRIRDFRGIELKNVDKNGILSVGLRENVVFPEINTETARYNFGLEITIVPTIKKREEAIELYRLTGIPLKK